MQNFREESEYERIVVERQTSEDLRRTLRHIQQSDAYLDRRRALMNGETLRQRIDDWPKLRAMVLHRDGKCMGCGTTLGLSPHHIKSRGSGGEDAMENVISLCVFCHDSAHRGFISPGRRETLSQARMRRHTVYEGKAMRNYFRRLLEMNYSYKLDMEA